MFFRNYSNYEGEAARLYREPNAIREDISEIKKRIEDANAMLNVRTILGTVIDECAEGEPSKWISALSDIVADAEESLRRLTRLEEALDCLLEELEDTLWVLGT